MDIQSVIGAAQAAQRGRDNPIAQVKQRIHQAIEATINTLANEMLIEARERAPVRKVFAGARTAGGRNEGIPHGGRNRLRALQTGDIGFPGASAAGVQLALRGSGRVTTRRSRIHGENPFSRGFDRRFLEARADALREQRRVNSIPMQRGRPGDRRAGERGIRQGDFSLGGNIPIPNARQVDVGPGGRIMGLTHGTYVEPALTSRGNYELRSGRAVFSSTGSVDVSASRTGAVTLGGRLKKEIDVQPLERDGSIILRRVVSPTSYAKYVEFGTRYAAAQPYLRPALAKQYTRFPSVLKAQLERAVRDLRGYSDVRAGIVQPHAKADSSRLTITKGEKAMFRRALKR